MLPIRCLWLSQNFEYIAQLATWCTPRFFVDRVAHLCSSLVQFLRATRICQWSVSTCSDFCFFALDEPNLWCHLFGRFSFTISSIHSDASSLDIPCKLQCSDVHLNVVSRASHVSTGTVATPWATSISLTRLEEALEDLCSLAALSLFLRDAHPAQHDPEHFCSVFEGLHRALHPLLRVLPNRDIRWRNRLRGTVGGYRPSGAPTNPAEVGVHLVSFEFSRDRLFCERLVSSYASPVPIQLRAILHASRLPRRLKKASRYVENLLERATTQRLPM